MNNAYWAEFYFWFCSIICLRVSIFTMHDLRFLNPACSFRILLSTVLETLASMILQNILLVSGTSVNPLQFSHMFWLPFLDSFTAQFAIPLGFSQSNDYPYLSNNWIIGDIIIGDFCEKLGSRFTDTSVTKKKAIYGCL